MARECIFTDTKHIIDKFYTQNSRKEYTKQDKIGYMFWPIKPLVGRC
jgi:hypothetical protein